MKPLMVVRKNWPWWLILSFVALLPTKNLLNLPIGIMAVLGLGILLTRRPALPNRRALTLLFALFGCIWIPMVVSLIDAVELEPSILTTLGFLRFPLMGVFMMVALREPDARIHLMWGVFVVSLFWCIDAFWQLLVGADIFGYPLQSSRLTGIFYPRYRLGIVLAAFLPIYLHVVRILVKRTWFACLLVPPVVTVIVLSGSRAGWFMLMLGLTFYSVLMVRSVGWRQMLRGRVILIGTAITLISSVTLISFPMVSGRAIEALNIFSVDETAIDEATRGRVSIWRPGVEIARSHWLNGVGVRGFRYEFLETAEADNFWQQQNPPGVTHPHMHLLEVMTETGIIGVIGYITFFILIIRLIRGKPKRLDWLAPLVLCVLLAMFPLNVHKALYGFFWSSLCWWLVFVALATYQNETTMNAACTDHHRGLNKQK